MVCCMKWIKKVWESWNEVFENIIMEDNEWKWNVLLIILWFKCKIIYRFF